MRQLESLRWRQVAGRMEERGGHGLLCSESIDQPSSQMADAAAGWLSNAVTERLRRCSRAGGGTDGMKQWRLELSLYALPPVAC